MDNVTHSLAGLVLAEAAVRLRARRTMVEPSPRFRTIALVSSAIAANLPDADLLYSGVGGDRLGYLLQHRGYTHTVAIALVMALCCWVVAHRALGRRPHVAMRADSRWLCGLLLVSTSSHLVLDWTNSYGVHPFWPVDDRWLYGDSVFIVEPWLWVVSIPALVAASRHRGWRVVLSLVLVAGLALAWGVDLVSRGAALALTFGALLSIALTRVLPPTARVAAGIGGWIVVTLVMAAGARVARERVVESARLVDPRSRLLDVIVSPLPANAVCMSVITVEETGGLYRVATARASAAPAISSAARCGHRSTSSLGPASRPSTAAVAWDGEWSAPGAELARLVTESCVALAAMRFIRAPIWRAMEDSSVLLGDVRYGGGSGGFTDVRVRRRQASCPRAVPPWIPPRLDLLRRAAERSVDR